MLQGVPVCANSEHQLGGYNNYPVPACNKGYNPVFNYCLYLQEIKSTTIGSMDNTSCTPRRWQLLKQKLNNLRPEDFARALARKNGAMLIDVRTPEEFQQAHLPGAVNINYLSPDLWERLEQLDPRGAYFIYCRTERRSMRVCLLMQNGGFSNVYNMEGGICAWEEAFGPAGVAVR